MREVDVNRSEKSDRFLLRDSVIDSLQFIVFNSEPVERKKYVEACSCQTANKYIRETPHNTLAKNGECLLCGYATFLVEADYPHLVFHSEEYLQSRLPKKEKRATLEEALFYLELKADLDFLESERKRIEG